MQEKNTQPFNLPNGTNHIKLQEAKESIQSSIFRKRINHKASESQVNAKLSKMQERTTCSSQHIPNIHCFKLLKLEITSTTLIKKNDSHEPNPKLRH